MKKSIDIAEYGKSNTVTYNVDLSKLSYPAFSIADAVLTTDMNDDMSHVTICCKYSIKERLERELAADPQNPKKQEELQKLELFCNGDEIEFTSLYMRKKKQDETAEEYFERLAADIADDAIIARPSTKLRYYRIHRGMTLEELSQKSGINRDQISRIELDKVKIENAILSTVSALASALDVRIEDLEMDKQARKFQKQCEARKN